MVLKAFSPYFRTVLKIQQMHWQEKFNNDVKFWLLRDSDRSTKRFSIRYKEELVIYSLFSSTAHTA